MYFFFSLITSNTHGFQDVTFSNDIIFYLFIFHDGNVQVT